MAQNKEKAYYYEQKTTLLLPHNMPVEKMIEILKKHYKCSLLQDGDEIIIRIKHE